MSLFSRIDADIVKKLLAAMLRIPERTQKLVKQAELVNRLIHDDMNGHGITDDMTPGDYLELMRREANKLERDTRELASIAMLLNGVIDELEKQVEEQDGEG